MTLKVKVGRYYRDYSGNKVGPMLRATDAPVNYPYFVAHEIGRWSPNGTTISGRAALASEWVPEVYTNENIFANEAPVDQDGYEMYATARAKATRDTPQQKQEAALRYDAGKSRIDLIPAEFIEALGAHYGVGAKKYAERNWEKGMSYSRCYASAQRHMLAFWRGEEIDEETGTPHVIAAAWNMAALHYYGLHQIGTDDRPKLVVDAAS